MIGRIAAWVPIAGLLCATAVPAGAQSPGPLAANPASGPAPLSVTFTASPWPSYDSAIDFGDGSAASQLRPVASCANCGAVTHVYQTNGHYVARLSAGPNVVGSATISVGQ
jgi:PKD domain-containing protein